MDISMEVISLEELMDIINKYTIIYIFKDEDSHISVYRNTRSVRSSSNIIAYKVGPSYYKFIQKDNT